MTDEEYEALENIRFATIHFRRHSTLFLRRWADAMEDTLCRFPGWRSEDAADAAAIHIGLIRALVDERERRRKSARHTLLVKEP